VLLLDGCARESEQVPVYPASGTIRWNGEPLAGALLVFHPTDSPASSGHPAPGATSQDDGWFAVSTYKPEDGLPEGNYRVTVSCEDRSVERKRGDDYPELLPARYQDPATSGLTVTITAEDNDLPLFDLVP
jgi:hypothetical protein